MGERMQHGDAAALRARLAALRHAIGGEEFGAFRASWPVGHGGIEPPVEPTSPPSAGNGARGLHLLARLGR
jgi:hypothetical protein